MTHTMQLNLGSVQIPLNAATKMFAIVARHGAELAEEFLTQRILFVGCDPIDVCGGDCS